MDHENLAAQVRAELLDEDDSGRTATQTASQSHRDQHLKAGPVRSLDSRTPSSPQFSGDNRLTTVDVIYENQRYNALADSFTPGDLLPSDLAAWTDASGNPRKREDVALPGGWEWTGRWKKDRNPEYYDPDGWEYSTSFGLKGWYNDSLPDTAVRRRKWVRERRWVGGGLKDVASFPPYMPSQTNDEGIEGPRADLGIRRERSQSDRTTGLEVPVIAPNQNAALEGSKSDYHGTGARGSVGEALPSLHRSNSESALKSKGLESDPSRSPPAPMALRSPAVTHRPTPSLPGDNNKAGMHIPKGELRVIQTEKGLAAEVTEVIFENQRSGLVGGFSTAWLMPYVDKRGEWSLEDGTPCDSKDTFKLRLGWEWVGEWQCSRNTDYHDADGWQYAFSFWDATWSKDVQAKTFVRRRMWTRNRRMYLDSKQGEAATEGGREEYSLEVDIRVVGWVGTVVVVLCLCWLAWVAAWLRVGSIMAAIPSPVEVPAAMCIGWDGSDIPGGCYY